MYFLFHLRLIGQMFSYSISMDCCFEISKCILAGLPEPLLEEYGQPLFVWLSRDWPIVRTYVSARQQIVWVGYGRLSKGREGCLRRVLVNSNLLYWTFTIWSIDSCQNRIATDQYHMIISQAQVSTHRGDVIYLEAVRWPINCFSRSRSMFNLMLSS